MFYPIKLSLISNCKRTLNAASCLDALTLCFVVLGLRIYSIGTINRQRETTTVFLIRPAAVYAHLVPFHGQADLETARATTQQDNREQIISKKSSVRKVNGLSLVLGKQASQRAALPKSCSLLFPISPRSALWSATVLPKCDHGRSPWGIRS